jgi:sialic acid synthase SpsE
VFKKKIYINKKIYLESSFSSNKVFIIAEAGVAHFGSFFKAKKLVDLARRSGADAIKFQAYKTEELVSPKYKNWYKRYKIKEVDFDFFLKLKKYCESKKIIFFLTPHSNTAIDWVKKLNLPIVKIGSGELENYDFISTIINLNKLIIISTGMHNEKSMRNLKKFFMKKKFYKVVFLRCITLYPTPHEKIYINSFSRFKDIFDPAIVGYSDHSNSDLPILSSVVLGARVIEKHISLDFNVKNAQDWKVSCDYNDFKSLINKIRNLEVMLGKNKIKISLEEQQSKIWATRSLHTKKDIKKGELFTKKNLIFLRPGNKKNFKYFKKIIGKKAKKNYYEGQKI